MLDKQAALINFGAWLKNNRVKDGGNPLQDDIMQRDCGFVTLSLRTPLKTYCRVWQTRQSLDCDARRTVVRLQLLQHRHPDLEPLATVFRGALDPQFM
ncbi:hypothetical protein [Paraherbaspirillum soli]|uniref:Uncharacterized protein n=1 Tax=Paraherbaspirillum soli TaxID=631222 RepID=A0ABW0M3G9_9BURK